MMKGLRNGVMKGLVADNPIYTVSTKMNTILIRTTNSTDPIYKVWNVDWKRNNVNMVTLNEKITGLLNYVSISDEFLYIRNSVATKHSGYEIKGSQLVELFDETLLTAEITDWKKSLVTDNTDKMTIVHEKNISDVITLYKEMQTSL